IRIPFNVVNPADIQTLNLKMKYNDGFVAYLNGTEIAKRNAPTSIAGITVADSIADWSNNPDVRVNGWSYGYYNQSLDADGTYSGGSDMTPFPHDGGGYSPTDFWQGSGYDWFNGNPPWTELFQEATHPAHPNGAVFDPNVPTTHIHWTVRRWSATVDANLKARIRFRKLNTGCGDGVRLAVYHNSVQVYSQTIAGNDGVGRDDTISIPDVFIGDNVDIMLGPGDGNDFCDGTAYSMVLFEGEPSIPWNGAATDSRTTSQTITPEAIDISAFISQLTPGANVLAIQGFNRGVSDNEFLINAQLLANRVPIAQNDNVTARAGTSTTYPASALLGNDSDADGDFLQIVGVNPNYTTAQGGAVRLYGDTVRYTPASGFTGNDSFQYTITDLSGVPVRATVTVNVSANQCPTASSSALAVDQGSTANFQLQASDPDGGSLQYIVTQPPARGVLIVNTQTGAATYSANNGCGSDSFKFKVNDGECDSAEATVAITINDRTAPVVTCNAPIVVQTANPNGTSVTYVSGASDDCGVRSLDCSPASGSVFPVGTTTVNCTAVNNAGLSNSCSFSVTVQLPNQPPTCVAKIVPEACGITFPSGPKLYAIAPHGDYVCLGLDGSGSSDPDGDSLTIDWTVDGTNHLSGAVVPACLGVGCHTITMTASDGRARCQQSLEICVITPAEAVEQLITQVESTNVERKNKRPLIVSLKASKAAFDRDGLGVGAQMLTVFEHKVRAQIARENPGEAAAFTQAVDNILRALECSIQTPRQEE
ncbi:MAG TPA: Ig-like domain-containing protein, partial [Verrucomicrobiae bacterium]|nr:Ig-like domain-containing protein [Verrucomicrobiae bacterium]